MWQVSGQSAVITIHLTLSWNYFDWIVLLLLIIIIIIILTEPSFSSSLSRLEPFELVHYHHHDNDHDNHQRLEPLKSCLAVWEDGERANEECFSIGSLATHTDLLKNCEFNIGILKWIYFEITFRNLNTGHLLRSQTVSDFSSPWDPSGQPRVKPAF